MMISNLNINIVLCKGMSSELHAVDVLLKYFINSLCYDWIYKAETIVKVFCKWCLFSALNRTEDYVL